MNENFEDKINIYIEKNQLLAIWNYGPTCSF